MKTRRTYCFMLQKKERQILFLDTDFVVFAPGHTISIPTHCYFHFPGAKATKSQWPTTDIAHKKKGNSWNIGYGTRPRILIKSNQ